MGIVVIFVSYPIGIYYNNIYLALYIYTILSCVQIISIGIFVLKIIDLSILMLLKKIVYYVFICIILSGVLLYVKLFTNLSLFPLFFVIGLCTLIYYSLVLYNDNELRNILVASIKNFNLLKK